MSNVITDAMNIATENQHKIDNLYGVLNNYKLSKKNKGYENDHSNKSLKDIKEVLTSTDMSEVANTTAEAEPTDLVFGAKTPVVYKEELGDLEATYNTIPGSANSTAVDAACYGNGTIVVLPQKKSGSTMNKVYYSTNEGATWTEKTLPTYQRWQSVCYGNDKFVAIAYNSNMFTYSLDGISWTKGTMPSSQKWYSVCYGKDKFVAVVHATNKFAYSSDGITWTQGTLPASGFWSSVCYGKDRFIAVAYNTVVFAYSLDGITWTQGNMVSSQWWKSICYGKDKFVAVVSNTNIFAYSSDGITWTQGNIPSSDGWYKVCYGKDKFVAISATDFTYSSDGITWLLGKKTYLAAKSQVFEHSEIVISTGSGFMLFGDSDSEIQYWKVDEVVKPIGFKEGKLPLSDDSNESQHVSYVKDKFIATADPQMTLSKNFAYSLDGISWSRGTLPDSAKWLPVCYGKDKFVMLPSASYGRFVYSSDGITWTRGSLPTSNNWGAACYGNGKFVALGKINTNIFIYSSDGITWTQGTLPVTKNWSSVCYGKDKFVAVATNNTGVFVYSSDGITWIEGTMDSAYMWQGVCYGKDKFVAVGTIQDTFDYSLDGITWTQGYMPADGSNWSSVCYGKDKFVAIPSLRDIFAYSSDGITWSKGSMSSNQSYATGSICYGKDKFVVVAQWNDVFAYSYNLPVYKNYAYHESALPADIGLSRNIEYEKGGFVENTLPVTGCSSVCYGNGKFVAVSKNTFIYSSDGNTWQKGSTLPRFANCGNTGRVCYGNGKFVVVFDLDCNDPNTGNPFEENVFAYSSDGINWSESLSFADGAGMMVITKWQDVCYGKDKFVAVSMVSSIAPAAYSSDGITWTVISDVYGGESICYGKDKFVIVSDQNNIYYSLDGISWVGCDSTAAGARKVCYGKDKFIALHDTGVYFYSSDGITWTKGVIPKRGWYSVCYGKDKFVTLAYNTNVFAYSLDGITWTEGTLPASKYWRSVCYGKDKFVMAASDNTKSIYTTPSNIFTTTSFSPTYTLVSTELSIKDILNSYGSSIGNYLTSTTSIETVDSNNYLNSTNVYTIDPTTYETAKVSSWDICKYIGDNKRPLMNNYRKIYAIKPIKNGMHKFFGWVYLDTHKRRLEVIFTKDFINYYTLLLGVGDTFFANGLEIPGDTDVSNITDTQITKAVQKYLSILPDNTIVYMNFSRMILKGSDPYKEDPTHPAEMCNIIDPFSNTQEVKSANNRTTFMTIRDDYGTGDYQNKAIAGISAYLNDNGEIIVYYNNRSEMPLTIYNGRVMNNTPYSTKYTNYSKEVIASPKVAKLFGPATTDTTNNISTFKTSINNMSMDLAITTVDSKDNTKNANESYLPAASVSLAIGDVSDRIYNNEDERFKHFNKVALFVNEAIENMDNIDIDFSNYMETTAIDRDSVVKDGKNDKEYKENGDFMWDNLPSAQKWRSVCYGKDKFVAVASTTNEFAYSSDGITWTQGTMLSKQYWTSVCYGKDKFVAVAYNTNIFAYSLDGITWTRSTLPVSSYWTSVCYGKDKFVAIGGSTNVSTANIFAYSLDGITWTQGTMPASGYWQSVCYGKDKFVAVVNISNIFAYSSDGITWIQGSMPYNDGCSSVCYGKNKFVAIGVDSNVFAYSTDGITWTEGTLSTYKSWTSVCYGKDKFVAVAMNINETGNEQQGNTFAYSTDGITWTQGTLPSEQYWNSVCYGKDKFVAVAYNTNVVAYSLDADPKSITSKIYNSNTLEINNRSENTDSNLRYRATVIGNTLLSDKFHMNNPRFTK